jgi:hypothetical protein
MLWNSFIVKIVLALLVGCTATMKEPTPTSLPDVPAWYLLLETDAFPRDWAADQCGPTDRLCFGETHALRVFGRVGVPGSVIQDVHRFEDGTPAYSMFQRARESDFNRCHAPRSPCGEFLPPAEANYRSPIADEYYLACGVNVVPACIAIIRYGNYFIEFFINADRGYIDGWEIEGNGLKVQEVVPILRAMDEHAARVLGIPLPTRTP